MEIMKVWCLNKLGKIKNLSFSVKSGEFVLIREIQEDQILYPILAGIDTSYKGCIKVGHTCCENGRGYRVRKQSQKISFIHENQNLIQGLSVYDNLLLPLQIQKIQADFTWMEDIISSFKLSKLLEIPVEELTKVEEYAVAAARAVLAKTPVIIVNFTDGMYSRSVEEEIISILKFTCVRYGHAILLFSRDEQWKHLTDYSIEI